MTDTAGPQPGAAPPPLPTLKPSELRAEPPASAEAGWAMSPQDRLLPQQERARTPKSALVAFALTLAVLGGALFYVGFFSPADRRMAAVKQDARAIPVASVEAARPVAAPAAAPKPVMKADVPKPETEASHRLDHVATEGQAHEAVEAAPAAHSLRETKPTPAQPAVQAPVKAASTPQTPTVINAHPAQQHAQHSAQASPQVAAAAPPAVQPKPAAAPKSPGAIATGSITPRDVAPGRAVSGGGANVAPAPAFATTSRNLSPPNVDSRDPYQVRAMSVGLHPQTAGDVLRRLSNTDYRNADVAIQTALAETPDGRSFVWPQQAFPEQATYLVRVGRGNSPGCRRYVVKIEKDGRTVTTPEMETCGGR